MKLSAIVLALALTVPSAVFAQARTDHNVIFGMYSGLALVMEVHHPENPNGYGIVFIRGTGWHRSLSMDELPISPDLIGRGRYGADELLERGYTLFSINHRAAPRFRYPSALEDAQRAVRFIRHHADRFGIDPDRIGAYGESSGGHLASLLGTLDGRGDAESTSPVDHESSKVQVVVTLYPPTDLMGWFTAPEADTDSLVSFMGLRPNGSAELYAQASPITHVSADDPPFLIVHGDADPIVPFSHSERFLDSLSDSGVPVELIRMPGGGHAANISAGPNPPDFVGPVADWFDRHLRQ